MVIKVKSITVKKTTKLELFFDKMQESSVRAVVVVIVTVYVVLAIRRSFLLEFLFPELFTRFLSFWFVVVVVVVVMVIVVIVVVMVIVVIVIIVTLLLFQFFLLKLLVWPTTAMCLVALEPTENMYQKIWS